ncbi:MAG: endonuclease domain-containing protein [Mycolicibacterium sp.]|uniref:endonuclease domain-containing protein n=1 Tax=Mycolicibacterium sp. TaxID=2320850 RepID=UPI003D0FAA97
MRGESGVARLDALGNATRFDPNAVLNMAGRHPGTPGIPRLRAALERHDRGAESSRETWLRLLLIRGGFPKPRTQIPVFDDYGRARYYLDMGWEDAMVAVEYDGAHHREPAVFGRDIIRAEFIAERHWKRVRVVAGQSPAEVLDRVARAWASSVRPDREIA